MNWYSEIATDYDYDTVMQKEKKKEKQKKSRKKKQFNLSHSILMPTARKQKKVWFAWEAQGLCFTCKVSLKNQQINSISQQVMLKLLP